MRVWLEPQDFRPQFDSRLGDANGLSRWTEHVHNVDRNVYVLQGRIGILAENLTPARAYRDNPVALLLEVAGNAMRRLSGVLGGPHNCDGPRRSIDFAQRIVIPGH